MQIRKLLFIIALCFCSTCALAEKKTIVIVSDDGPPHMIKATDSGIDIDITRAALSKAGFQSEVTYSPLARAKMLVEAEVADVVVPTFLQKDTDTLYFSKPYLRYKPTVFSLKSNQIKLGDLNELSNYKIATFQGATGYFGETFKQVSMKTVYQEFADMSVLPSLLAKNRFDIVVLDYYIFYFYSAKQGLDSSQFNQHKLIPPVPAYAAFHNKEIRDKFNRGLKKLSREEINAIVSFYLTN